MMETAKLYRAVCTLTTIIALSIAASTYAAEWGKIMYSPSKANIRAKRSAESRLKGQLKAGERVRADYLRGSWYAVFPVRQKRRDEKRARGYVYAPLLRELPLPAATGPKEEEKPSKSPVPEPAKGLLPIGVKDITFKLADDGKERLLIRFDRFYTPVLSGVQGIKPRIIVDISDSSSLDGRFAVMETRGQLVKRVRSSWNPRTRAARIVLDMEPTKNCFVKPIFYEQDNTYCLEVEEEHPPSP
jgi:hypothetical protein